MQGFIFGGNTGETAQSLARKRAVAEAMLQQSSLAPRNIGEGLTAIGNALAGRAIERRVDREEGRRKKEATSRFDEIVATLGGPVTPTGFNPSAPTPPAIEARDLPPTGFQGSLQPGGSIYDAIETVESGGDPNAVSPVGATGVMQIMPATARDPGFGVANIFETARALGRPVADESDATLQALLRDEEVNRTMGRAYFDAMKGRYGGDVTKALASYNAGPGAVDQYGGVPPFEETQNYVQKIGGMLGQPVQPASMAQPAQPMGQPSPMGGLDQRLLQLASEEYLSEPQRMVVNALLQQQIAQMTPREMTEFERLAQGLDPSQAERARMIRLGLAPDADTALRVGASERGAFRQATPEEAAAYGAPGGQFGPDGRFYPINPPSGMAIEADGQGGVRVIQGPGAQQRPFTEGQSKDVVYATRARGALEAFEPLAGNMASITDRALNADPTGLVRGEFQSPDFQVAQNAGNEFLQAILRKDTGAAITEQEQTLYGRTYLPQPGDGPEVMAEKARARQRAIAAIEAGMSPAQMVAQERGIQRARDASRASPPPAGVEPEDWEAMTPEERALFQ